MVEVTPLPQLVTEPDAYALFPLLEDKELRRARQNGEIGYFDRKGRIYYRLDELQAYMARKLQQSYVPPCQKNLPSASDDTGSTKFQAQPTGINFGMTPQLEKRAADLLERRISSKPKSNSQPTSSKKAPVVPQSQKTPC
jgi:hypothetical protein